MTRVKRATNTADLAALLERVRPDDRNPIILADTPADGAREPQYTVIWEEGDVVEP